MTPFFKSVTVTGVLGVELMWAYGNTLFASMRLYVLNGQVFSWAFAARRLPGEQTVSGGIHHKPLIQFILSRRRIRASRMQVTEGAGSRLGFSASDSVLKNSHCAVTLLPQIGCQRVKSLKL